jgi:hypothetical protein
VQKGGDKSKFILYLIEAQAQAQAEATEAQAVQEPII